LFRRQKDDALSLLSDSESRSQGSKSCLNIAYQRFGIYDLPYFFNREIRLIGLAEVFKDQMSKLFSPTFVAVGRTFVPILRIEDYGRHTAPLKSKCTFVGILICKTKTRSIHTSRKKPFCKDLNSLPDGSIEPSFCFFFLDTLALVILLFSRGQCKFKFQSPFASIDFQGHQSCAFVV
jgi:hypothetical protein